MIVMTAAICTSPCSDEICSMISAAVHHCHGRHCGGDHDAQRRDANGATWQLRTARMPRGGGPRCGCFRMRAARSLRYSVHTLGLTCRIRYVYNRTSRSPDWWRIGPASHDPHARVWGGIYLARENATNAASCTLIITGMRIVARERRSAQ